MCATMHLLHFSILLLPCKWRVELAYDTEPEKLFQLPKWGDARTWSFPCPNKPHPCARVWGGIFSHLHMALRGIYTHTHSLIHTYTLYMKEATWLEATWRQNHPPPQSVSWTVCPHTQCLLDF